MRVVGIAVLGVCLVFVSVAAGLPDGRVYEQVSPTVKNGFGAGANTVGEPLYSAASPEDGFGQPLSFLYGGSGPLGSTTSGVDVLSVARRSDAGWGSVAAIPRNVGKVDQNRTAPAGIEPSADLKRVLFTSTASFGQGNPDTPFGSGSIYLAGIHWVMGDDLLWTGESGILSWVGRPTIGEPDPVLGGVEYSSRLRLAGGDEALSDVYFTYYGTLALEDAISSAEGQSRAKLLKEDGGANSPNAVGNWGFYEWHEGVLINAGELPHGSPIGRFDPYGAVPAGTVQRTSSSPIEYDNQVSSNGRVALFVSPPPEAGSGRTPELYARVRESGTEGNVKSLLVSEDTLLPEVGGLFPSAPTGPLAVSPASSCPACQSYAFASADGSQVFFASTDRLTADASKEEGTVKTYRFDTATGALRYLSGVTQPIVGVSHDGTRVLFENTEMSPAQLELWTGGQVRGIAVLEIPKETAANSHCKNLICIGPVRFARGGEVAVFATDAALPGFNDVEGSTEVYRFDSTSSALACVSCPPTGTSAGDAILSNNDQYDEGKGNPIDSRGVSADGSRVFFDTSSALVPQDVNGRRDVYEWENGRVYLLSSGVGPSDSFLLDNTPSGNDVFFTTLDGLTASDVDKTYDVYDARVNGRGAAGEVASGCENECQGLPNAPPAFASDGTTAVFVEGNLQPANGSPASAPVKAKPKKRAKPRPKRGKRRARKSRRARSGSFAGARGVGR